MWWDVGEDHSVAPFVAQLQYVADSMDLGN
jgi:hypothetical protein